MTDMDPTTTNPDYYRVLWENDDVRVLEYEDVPGDETTPHRHPDSVMVTLSDFERRLSTRDSARDVSLTSGSAVWLPAQVHSGKNIGRTATHSILIELKKNATRSTRGQLGPDV